MFSHHRGAADESAEGTKKPATPARTWGDKLVLIGISLRGLSMISRLAPYSRLLRFAGTGPMAIGALVTVYEVGGWRLLLGIPSTVAMVFVAGQLADGVFEERLRTEVIADLRTGCPDIPEELFCTLQQTPVHHYETNRFRLEVQLPGVAAGAPHWKVFVSGARQHMSQPWSVTKLQASCGAADEHKATGIPPPQTRCWDCNTVPVQWNLIWQKQ